MTDAAYARVTVACFMAGAPMPPKGAAFAYKMILLTIRMRGRKL